MEPRRMLEVVNARGRHLVLKAQITRGVEVRLGSQVNHVIVVKRVLRRRRQSAESSADAKGLKKRLRERTKIPRSMKQEPLKSKRITSTKLEGRSLNRIDVLTCRQ